MRKILLVTMVTLVALVASATALATPKTPLQHCTKLSQVAKPLFGTGAKYADVAACVAAQTAHEAQNTTNAAKTCKTERGTTTVSRAAFAAKYGTNANDKNAFGKCVSATAKAKTGEDQTAELNAAKTCKAERGTTAASKLAFASKYGTNASKKNAFGKCVAKVQTQNS